MSQANSESGERIDLARLRQDLLADDSFLREIIETFIDEVDLCLVQLNQAASEGETNLVGQWAHRLKGSLRTIGLAASAKSFERLESAALSVDYGTPSANQLIREANSYAASARGAAVDALQRLKPQSH